MKKKVFVSGCYDLLHSGHIEFFRQAASYGELYVGIGSDATIRELKHHAPMFPEAEIVSTVDTLDARLYEMFDALNAVEVGKFSDKVWGLDNRQLYRHGYGLNNHSES